MTNVTSIIVRISLAVIFIISAITKMMSIDTFELYVFSKSFGSFGFNALVVRIILGIEFLIAALLLFSKNVAKSLYLSLIVMLGFTGYLLVDYFVTGNEENCRCFGEVFEFSTGESIVKNIVIIAIIITGLFIKKHIVLKLNKYIVIGVLSISFVLPTILYAPDFIYNDFEKIYTNKYEDIDVSKVGAIVDSTGRKIDYLKGDAIVVFASMHCTFCKMTTQKLSVMHQNEKVKAKIGYVFFGDKKELNQFWENSQTNPFPYTIINPELFFKISQPQLPTVYYLKDGKIIARMDFRSLSEENIEKLYKMK